MIFPSSLFRSCRSLKRATLSNSILSIFKKERPWANQSHRSLQKSDHKRIALLDLYKRTMLVIHTDSSDSLVFFTCFWKFLPLFMSKEQIATVTLRSFLKIDGVNLFLAIIFKKERSLANWSHRSSKKSDREQTDLMSEGIYSLFSRSNRSFALSTTKNNRFARKTVDRFPNPALTCGPPFRMKNSAYYGTKPTHFWPSFDLVLIETFNIEEKIKYCTVALLVTLQHVELRSQGSRDRIQTIQWYEYMTYKRLGRRTDSPKALDTRTIKKYFFS